LVNTNITR